MSATDDRLEILIGKLLDGEISPAEQRRLDDELERNEDARELLERLRTLNDCGRQVVAAEIHGQGSSPDEILRRAWRRHERPSWRHVLRADGHLRFAAGLAAGFVLGLLLHFALTLDDEGAARPAGPPVAATEISVPEGSRRQPMDRGIPSYSSPVMRNVDWYGFTDSTGNQWLVEGLREGSVQPTVYYGDL